MRTGSVPLEPAPRDHRVVHEAIWAPLAALVLLAARFLPFDRLPEAVCPFLALTGLPCLTCGGTRSLMALTRFDLMGALAMNPMLALAGLAAVAYVVHALGVGLLGRSPWRPEISSARVQRALRIAAVVAVLGNWAYLIAVGR